MIETVQDDGTILVRSTNWIKLLEDIKYNYEETYSPHWYSPYKIRRTHVVIDSWIEPQKGNERQMFFAVLKKV